MSKLPESERKYIPVKNKMIAYYNTQGLYKGLWHIGKRDKNGKFYPKILCASEQIKYYVE